MFSLSGNGYSGEAFSGNSENYIPYYGLMCGPVKNIHVYGDERNGLIRGIIHEDISGTISDTASGIARRVVSGAATGESKGNIKVTINKVAYKNIERPVTDTISITASGEFTDDFEGTGKGTAYDTPVSGRVRYAPDGQLAFYPWRTGGLHALLSGNSSRIDVEGQTVGEFLCTTYPDTVAYTLGGEVKTTLKDAPNGGGRSGQDRRGFAGSKIELGLKFEKSFKFYYKLGQRGTSAAENTGSKGSGGGGGGGGGASLMYWDCALQDIKIIDCKINDVPTPVTSGSQLTYYGVFCPGGNGGHGKDGHINLGGVERGAVWDWCPIGGWGGIGGANQNTIFGDLKMNNSGSGSMGFMSTWSWKIYTGRYKTGRTWLGVAGQGAQGGMGWSDEILNEKFPGNAQYLTVGISTRGISLANENKNGILTLTYNRDNII